VLKRIFAPRGNGERGEWRTLHEQYLNISYSSSLIMKIKSKDEMDATYNAHTEDKTYNRNCSIKPEGKTILRKFKRR
jgi:hypothetical protein